MGELKKTKLINTTGDDMLEVLTQEPVRAVETRRCHPEIVAVPDHVRVGIVGVDDGVRLRAVAVVGDPRIGAHNR